MTIQTGKGPNDVVCGRIVVPPRIRRVFINTEATALELSLVFGPAVIIPQTCHVRWFSSSASFKYFRHTLADLQGIG